MIRKLIAVALLALVAGPLVSLHMLGGIGVRTSVTVIKPGGAVAAGVTFETLLSRTRL